jgi:hypothetical protein
MGTLKMVDQKGKNRLPKIGYHLKQHKYNSTH